MTGPGRLRTPRTSIFRQTDSFRERDGEARLEAAITAHRAAGGRVAVATHQPLAIPDAMVIALDDFAAASGDPLAAWW